MIEILFNLLAFVLAILILVTVHEFGHFWVAKKCGIKVLKFSVGFGKALFTKKIGETEFVLSAIPLGGYVKMLDARESEVSAEDLPREFNSQPLLSRVLVVAAGPMFNFIFAAFAYWLVFVSGTTGLHTVVGAVTHDSTAAVAQFQEGDLIQRVNGKEVKTWQSFMGRLAENAITGKDLVVEVDRIGQSQHELRVSTQKFLQEPKKWMRDFGLQPALPVFKAIIGEVIPGKPAFRAGLKQQDEVVSIARQKVSSWQEMVKLVSASPNKFLVLKVYRPSLNETIEIQLTPEAVLLNGATIGRIGVKNKIIKIPKSFQMTERYGAFESIGKSIEKTWSTIGMTFAVIGKMLTGELAVKDGVAGPVVIGQFAGATLLLGFASFVGFLAMISVSLGVMNLLPIPVLDGGHLLHYLIEFIKGSPLSEGVALIMQKIGLFLVFGWIIFVLYNDIIGLL